MRVPQYMSLVLSLIQFVNWSSSQACPGCAEGLGQPPRESPHLASPVTTPWLQAAGPSVMLEDTYAIILSASRYWFNYRHSSNALAIYHSARRLGIPDDRILLFLADDHGCSPRNVDVGAIYNEDGLRDLSVLPEDAEVDFSGYEVTPDSFLRAISGRPSVNTPTRRRISPGRSSNLLVYLTGHGGDGFLKFHDKEEMTYQDFASALADAHAKGRYGRALVIADTCQAATIGDGLGISTSSRASSSRPAGSNDAEGNGSNAMNATATAAFDINQLASDAFSSLSSVSAMLLDDFGAAGSSPGGDGDEPISHTPATLVLASSVRGQNSYAYGMDHEIGLSLSDGFTRIVHDSLVRDFGFRGAGGGNAAGQRRGSDSKPQRAASGRPGGAASDLWRAHVMELADALQPQLIVHNSTVSDGQEGNSGGGAEAGDPDAAAGLQHGRLGGLCKSQTGEGSASSSSPRLSKACEWLDRQQKREHVRHGWHGVTDSVYASLGPALHGHRDADVPAAAAEEQRQHRQIQQQKQLKLHTSLSATLQSLLVPEWRISSSVVSRDAGHVPVPHADPDLIGRSAASASSSALAASAAGVAGEPLLRYLAHASTVQIPQDL